MKDGLLSVVAVAGGVAVALLWSMSVHDPYWRLFDTPSVPAPAYDRSEDLRAVLASVTREFANNDSGAMSPAADPLASAERANIRLDIPLEISLREAEAAAIPEPMIALVPPLEPEPMTGPAIGSMIAHLHRREYRVHRRQPDAGGDHDRELRRQRRIGGHELRHEGDEEDVALRIQRRHRIPERR